MKSFWTFIALTAFSVTLYGQQEATTTNGRLVILYNNGTWEYKKEDAPKPKVIAEPPITECDYWKNDWKADEGIGRQFTRSKKIGYMSFMNDITIGDITIELRRSDSELSLIAESTGIECVGSSSSIHFILKSGETIRIDHSRGRDCSISPPLHAQLTAHHVEKLKSSPLAAVKLIGENKDAYFNYITQPEFFQHYMKCIGQ